jgi:sugar O-acyltransferase (sialic acid O-acetyltransferase NeuD family)
VNTSASQTPIFVYGAGGHGKVVADILLACGVEIEGFIDDDPEKHGESFGLKVSGDGGWLAGQATHRPVSVALGIGNNESRRMIAERCTRNNVGILTAVHPSAAIARSAQVSAGVVIMAHAVVNPDSVIAPGAIINTAAIVEHDCRVGNFAHLSPRVTIGGRVEVADLSWLGMGSTVLPGLRIGTGSVVGAGATVLDNVDDWVVVVGSPARIVKELARRI